VGSVAAVVVVGFHAQGSSVVGFPLVGIHGSSSVAHSGVIVVGLVIGSVLVGRSGDDGITTGPSVGYELISCDCVHPEFIGQSQSLSLWWNSAKNGSYTNDADAFVVG